jgi:hypothetical protein
MMLGRTAIALSLATILSLNLILLLGAGVRDPRSIRPLFGGLVMVMDLSLVSSSVLLGFLFARRRNTPLAALFFLNLGLFAVAFILVAFGVRFHPLLLYAADLYWLNLYLICLARYGRTISS